MGRAADSAVAVDKSACTGSGGLPDSAVAVDSLLGTLGRSGSIPQWQWIRG